MGLGMGGGINSIKMVVRIQPTGLMVVGVSLRGWR